MGVIAQMVEQSEPPRLYLPGRHAFACLTKAEDGAHTANAVDARVTGAIAGCTLRLVGDYAKVSAAYQHPESLLWRDAGIVTAGLCIIAEWMDLTSIPIGLTGSSHLRRLGFPADRFIGLGAVHVGGRL